MKDNNIKILPQIQYNKLSYSNHLNNYLNSQRDKTPNVNRESKLLNNPLERSNIHQSSLNKNNNSINIGKNTENNNSYGNTFINKDYLIRGRKNPNLLKPEFIFHGKPLDEQRFLPEINKRGLLLPKFPSTKNNYDNSTTYHIHENKLDELIDIIRHKERERNKIKMELIKDEVSDLKAQINDISNTFRFKIDLNSLLFDVDNNLSRLSKEERLKRTRKRILFLWRKASLMKDILIFYLIILNIARNRNKKAYCILYHSYVVKYESAEIIEKLNSSGMIKIINYMKEVKLSLGIKADYNPQYKLDILKECCTMFLKVLINKYSDVTDLSISEAQGLRLITNARTKYKDFDNPFLRLEDADNYLNTEESKLSYDEYEETNIFNFINDMGISQIENFRMNKKKVKQKFTDVLNKAKYFIFKKKFSNHNSKMIEKKVNNSEESISLNELLKNKLSNEKRKKKFNKMIQTKLRNEDEESNETKGYYGVEFLLNFEICRLDFNHLGQIKNLNLYQAAMLVASYITIKVYVSKFLVLGSRDFEIYSKNKGSYNEYNSDNHKDFFERKKETEISDERLKSNLSVSMIYFGSLIYYLVKDTFTEKLDLFKQKNALINYYRAYHIEVGPVEETIYRPDFQGIYASDFFKELSDYDDVFFTVIKRKHIAPFIAAHKGFVTIFKETLYKWSLLLTKSILKIK